MGDWIFDHIGWLFGIIVAVIAGLTIWAVASGGFSCPKGQQAVLLYMQPIITAGANGVETVTMVPIYGCQQ